MQIKPADGRQADLDALTDLLTRPDIDVHSRKAIDQQIRTISAGWKGEREAAFEIEFYLGKSPNYATIHDLRIEHDGHVAQIDHLVIDRLLEIWVCESKHFSDGVSINEHGEWSRNFGGRPRGVPSPIEQNRRHMYVLERLFHAGVVKLPRRAFRPIKPDLKPVVLVSNNTHIKRSKGIEGIETVIKAEKLRSFIEATFDDRAVRLVGRAIGQDTLEALARELAALHRPSHVDWAARFGLVPAPADRPSSDGPKPAGQCASCGGPVSAAEAYYCRNVKRERFGGKVYCRACQQKVA